MNVLHACRRLLLGAKLDPLNPHTRQHIVLIAFLAWIGLGADGLSSACYGPEEAFLALGVHTHLGLYLAIATALTVFIIALAYNQVIELFPSGGGGYKAATRLIGPYAGLLSGSALIVDYVLTITISVASAADAVYSLLPPDWQMYKFVSELALVGLLILLNLRGMKESIQILLPIFLGFFLSHALLIGYGIAAKSELIDALMPETLRQTDELFKQSGWLFTVSLFLRAYSLGGGTYTGIEAVSNNINMLAEPRVRTGHLTMFYMATSLAFTAGGIILLYLLWQATPVEGQTLNAVTFKQVIESLGFHSPQLNAGILALTLGLEGGLLLVAANTGFLGGPAVMANMAADRWVPRQFRQLSSRMVTQNGVLMMGGAALLILLWSHGAVSLLVVLYSINVFLTFSLSLFGLCKHWWEQRRFVRGWWRRLALSGLGLLVTGFILMVTIAEKFTEGGWITLLITSTVVAVCVGVRRHYEDVQTAMERVDDSYSLPLTWDDDAVSQPPDPSKETAVLFVGGNRGAGMHMLQWVLRQFPGRFHNFVFVAVGEVDKQAFDSARAIKSLQARIDNSLRYFCSYCVSLGHAATSYQAYGADPLEELSQLTTKVLQEFPHSVCFASKLFFDKESLWRRLLHNQMPLAMQRRLQLAGQDMMIVPVHVPETLPQSRMPIK
ncbi:MAG: APC family permease [Nevskia sp.]|nr:APC family permease [Nevskia sp.]